MSTTPTVNVNTSVTPTFTQVGAICSGASLSALPTTSINGITGTWSPALNNTTTTTYTFTPNAGQCATTTTMTITVNALPIVSFSGLATTYCSVNAPVTLTGSPVGGTFSGPGISGNTFNPATAGAGGPYTITYSYTAGNGCSNTSSQQVTVTSCASINITGIVTNVNCFGASTGAVDITVTDGTFPYTYSWSNGPATQDIPQSTLLPSPAGNCPEMDSPATPRR